MCIRDRVFAGRLCATAPAILRRSRSLFLKFESCPPKTVRKTDCPWRGISIEKYKQTSSDQSFPRTARTAPLQCCLLYTSRTPVYPDETMCGSLLRYIATPTRDFQPMGANMGILPSQEERVRDKRKRYEMLAQRAVNALQESLVCE